MKNSYNLRKIRKTTVKNKTVELLHIIMIQEGYSRKYIEEYMTSYRNNFNYGDGNRYIKRRYMYLPGGEFSDVKIINLTTLENSEDYVYKDIVPLLPEHIKDKVMLDLILLNSGDNFI